MPLNKTDFITNKIKSLIGDPIVSAIDADTSAITNAISLAEVQYWNSFPHCYRETFSVQFTDTSEKLVSINTLLGLAFPSQSVRDKAYLLGILSIDKVLQSETSSNLDSYLLGRTISNTSSYLQNYEKRLKTLTEDDLVSGDISFKLDEVNGNVIFILPSNNLEVSVVYAFGFADGLDYISNQHLLAFSKMCAVEYLDMLISGRTAIGLQGDYSVDVSHMTDILNRLREEVDEYKRKMAEIPLIYS